ncbi:WD40 repeat protein [Paucibacter oligotrophus]|uniref:WD40 repeat protein n=1 Tax=Roseateles oligotrophus TaxID=1769250 RepID=A0A840L9L0_9BURK|nr:AAA family ATPase [Roseateles oligotrophus]MBB4844860.1 WD40 repeat protein [Roseateles oligotrophus]
MSPAAEEALQRLLAANPFPGLRSFEPAEADRFFGREGQIQALLERLAQWPLVAVSGASGCGKSSLVKAGLLNELRRRHLEEDEAEWLAVLMRPGIQPIAALAAALLPVLEPAPEPDPAAAAADLSPAERRLASLHGQLRLGGMALVELVRRANLPPGLRVLVVVDQFEEIFRFKRMADADEASAFVKLLLQAVEDAGSRIRVVLTLRSDTLGGCADFPGLAEAVSAGGYLVPRLNRQQRKDAIIKPVALRGAEIAPRLVQRLLSDVSSDFDDLPVMQHALSRSWQHWARDCGGSRPIDLQDYEAVGGALDALSRHADEALDSLGVLGEPGGAVERVFRALTERMAEGVEVRRPIELAQLCAICADPGPAPARGRLLRKAAAPLIGEAEVLAVLERYRRSDTAFLLPAPGQALQASSVIDISHESLIRQWTRLRGWVLAEAEAKAALLRLVADARAQQAAAGELWRGRSLERARDWQQRKRPNPAWVRLCTGGSEAQAEQDFQLVKAFLDQSAEAQDKEQGRRRAMLWSLRGLGLLVTVVSLGAALNGMSQHERALSREWGAKALLQIARDPARSAALALAAVNKDEANERGEFALRRAMAALELSSAERILNFPEPLLEARYSPDQRRLLVAGEHSLWVFEDERLTAGPPAAGEGSRPEDLQVLHVKLPERLGKLSRAWLLDDGRMLVINERGEVVLLDAQGAVQSLALCAAGSVAWGVALHPLQPELALSCVDAWGAGSLSRWQLGEAGGEAGAAPRQIRLLSDSAAPVTALAYTPDGQYLASGDSAGRLAVWRGGQAAGAAWIEGRANRRFGHAAAINELVFSPSQPGLLASAGDDGFARVWHLDLAAGRLATGADGEHQMHHDRSVSKLRFLDRADDKNLLLTVSDWRVNLWSHEQRHEERRHDDWVNALDVSRLDGELLVAASQDGTARVWSSRSTVALAQLRGHTNLISRVLLNERAGQRRVITSSLDGSLRVWRLQLPHLLLASKRPQLSFALAPAGMKDWGQDRLIMLCGEAGSEAGSDSAACAFSALSRRVGEGLDEGVASEHFAIKRSARQQAAQARAETGNISHSTDTASFSADGMLAMVFSRRYNIYSERQLWSFSLEGDGLSRLAPAWMQGSQMALFDPKQAQLALQDKEGGVKFWPVSALAASAPPGQPLLAFKCGDASCLGLALSADGRWIATAEGGVARLWDRRQGGRELARLDGHQGDLRDIAFSPDSQMLVTASADSTARVWELAPLLKQGPAAAPLQELPSRQLGGGHSSSLSSAAFSPDSHWVVTAGADGSIRVWDSLNGQEKAALLGRHRGKVNQAAFHPDGRSIISVGDDGTALVSPCEACVLPLAELKARAARQLQLSEDDKAWLEEMKAAPSRRQAY